MNREYVEIVEGGYRIRGSRISLDSVVYAFWRGETPESIAQSFPLLTLEQVYGSLTYYLAHKTEVDTSIEEARDDYESMREEARQKDPMFYRKLADARRSIESA